MQISRTGSLVLPDQLKEIVDWLADKAAGARIVPVVHADLPSEIALESFLGRPRAVEAARTHQNPIFPSTNLMIDTPIDVTVLAERLAGVGLARAKGFAIELDGTMTTIQVVGKRWTVTPAPSRARPGIVCIGIDGQLDIDGLTGIVDATQ